MKFNIAMIAALALAGSLYIGQSALAGEGCCPLAGKPAKEVKKEVCGDKKDCDPAKKKDCADKKDCDVKEKKAGECKVDTAK